jgi:REP element-mobilizing transposase RayT
MHDDDLFAIFVTWTCYGTWLPGDPRGYVSDTFAPDATRTVKRNIPGTPITANDKHTRAIAKSRQKHPTIWLNRNQADVAARGLLDAASERTWCIRRAAVMANHVHVLVMDCPPEGSAVRRILKGVSQAKLSDAHGKPKKWWTRGGSNRKRIGESAILATERYIANQSGILAEIVNNVLIEQPRRHS